MTDNFIEITKINTNYILVSNLDQRIESLKLETDKMLDEVFKSLLNHFTSGLFGFLMKPLVKFIFKLVGLDKMHKNVKKQQELLIDTALELMKDKDKSKDKEKLIQDSIEELLLYDNIFNYLDKSNLKTKEIKNNLIFYYMQNIKYIINLLKAPKNCPST
ncbi:MAG: hypothetical protein GF329_14295, partial [Candidatus Lokiarchaeota archaeon]|nr:hypothetical protein [Candidatus Lokiarchaeota archaeon]